MNNNIYLTRQEVSKLLNVSAKVINRISKNENWNTYKINNQYNYLKNDVFKYIKKLENLNLNYISATKACEYLNYPSSTFSRLCQEMNWEYLKESNSYYYKLTDIEKYKNELTLFNSNEYIHITEAVTKYGLSENIIRYLIKKSNITKLDMHGRTKYNKQELENCIQNYIKYNKILKNIKPDSTEIDQNMNLKDHSNDYMTYSAALLYLNISKAQLDKQLTKTQLKRIGNSNLIQKSFIEQLYSMRKSFWSDKYTDKQAREKLPQKLFHQLEKIPIPSYALPKSSSNNKIKYAYSKQEVCLKEKLFNEPGALGYISSDNARKILDLSRAKFLTFVKEFKLNSINISDNTKYYLKSDIDFFKEQQKDLGITYLTSKMAYEKYGKIRFLGRSLRGFNIPSFCNTSKFNSKEMCFKTEDIENYIKNSSIHNILGESEVYTFKNRLDFLSEKLPFFNDSIYTKNKWLEYVHIKLAASEDNSSKTKYNLVKSLLNCTSKLDELLSHNNTLEIYSLSTNQINFWFQTIPNERNRIYIYQFLELVYNDMLFKAEFIKFKNTGFRLKELIKPDSECFNSTKKTLKFDSDSIYDYEEYITLFKHLINIPLHVKRSLDNIYKNNDISYLSCWLYLLIHLNNGWRHGDVTRFPRLYLSDILDEWEICNLDWFKVNEVSIPQSRRIISRITEYDFRISKTDVYGHFFCSDRLAPSISTAILMLECYYKYFYIGAIPELDAPIMNFSSTKFNEPSNTIILKCIDGANLKNFTFTTRKMNRSVLTYLYNVANEISSCGYNALILPKYLRAHIDSMSTIQYIQFDSKQLEFLSGELFVRGEFGFITDSLLNMISTKPNKSIIRTSEIKCVHELFGSTEKIEATSRMLNKFEDEKVEIINILTEKGYDECVNTVSNIFLGNMPSKIPNIQCLFSEQGCRCPNISCENCKYKIPSIYVLKTICSLVREEIDMYMSTKHIGKKIKLSSQIHNHVDIILEAIKKYGQEYVYNCLDIDRGTFLNLFASIEPVEYLLTLKG